MIAEPKIECYDEGTDVEEDTVKSLLEAAFGLPSFLPPDQATDLANGSLSTNHSDEPDHGPPKESICSDGKEGCATDRESKIRVAESQEEQLEKSLNDTSAPNEITDIDHFKQLVRSLVDTSASKETTNTNNFMWDALMGILPEEVKHDIRQWQWVLIVGIIITGLYIACFLVLFISGYQGARESKFLSLEKDAGVCKTVPISTSINTLVDVHGNFDASSAFMRSDALFELHFASYKGDPDTWKVDMKAVTVAITAEIDFLKSISDLPLKILHLSSWRTTIVAKKSGTIRVWFNAYPGYIFNIPNSQLDTKMGSIAEACDRDADVWSYGDGILSLTFNDIWDGSSVDANTGAANITSANKCSSFDLVRNGYDVAYKTVDWTLDLS